MSLINWTIYKFDIKSSVSVIGHLMDFLFISDISLFESSYLSHKNRFLNRTQIVIINKIKMAGGMNAESIFDLLVLIGRLSPILHYHCWTLCSCR